MGTGARLALDVVATALVMQTGCVTLGHAAVALGGSVGAGGGWLGAAALHAPVCASVAPAQLRKHTLG